MEMKAYPAFGYVLTRCKIAAGTVINDISVANGVMTVASVDDKGIAVVNNNSYVWLHTSGQQTYTALSTGVLTVRHPGWCNLKDVITADSHEIRVDADSEHICLSSYLNESRRPSMPNVAYFSMQAGEQRTIAQGTKLYLAQGTLSVGGVAVPQMRQIHIKSGDTVVAADTDCLGLVFLD